MKSRNAIAELALSWVGLNEKDGSFKPIIDIYNKGTAGYDLKYTDAWCAATVSALAIVLGYTDIIPVECSCARMTKKAQQMGIWVEDDNFVPNVGDIIMYDWQDDGKGDNKGNPDHVGIVTSVSNGKITVVEGNKNNAVGTRKTSVGAKYIRGYITPRYDAEQSHDAPTAPVEKTAKYKGVVTAWALNVRSGAGTNYSIIKTLKRDTVVDILEEKNGWGRIDTKGWVSLKWIRRA